MSVLLGLFSCSCHLSLYLVVLFSFDFNLKSFSFRSEKLRKRIGGPPLPDAVFTDSFTRHGAQLLLYARVLEACLKGGNRKDYSLCHAARQPITLPACRLGCTLRLATMEGYGSHSTNRLHCPQKVSERFLTLQNSICTSVRAVAASMSIISRGVCSTSFQLCVAHVLQSRLRLQTTDQ